jgi:hypothetical protein
MSTIRGMMASCPAERMTLDEMTMVRPVRRIRETEGVSAALVEEGVDFLEKVLGE